VSRLLVKAAARSGKQITAIEWPGGEPQTLQLEVSDKVVKTVLAGANRLPLGSLTTANIRRFAALPWGSCVNLRSPNLRTAVVVGPAQFGARWYLPIIGPDVSNPSDTARSLEKTAKRKRTSLGYSALMANPSRG
jgi:hypothetical protein